MLFNNSGHFHEHTSKELLESEGPCSRHDKQKQPRNSDAFQGFFSQDTEVPTTNMIFTKTQTPLARFSTLRLWTINNEHPAMGTGGSSRDRNGELPHSPNAAKHVRSSSRTYVRHLDSSQPRQPRLQNHIQNHYFMPTPSFLQKRPRTRPGPDG